ncbi:hypothetical protein Q3G72_008479 [Acer saccharum]|nr:hypothetical protein Q3G72_008479 [Acer saccharum]
MVGAIEFMYEDCFFKKKRQAQGEYYLQLLSRVFDSLRENNPELATGDRRKGSKKTVLVNFMDIYETMRRRPDHVMAFLLAEMGTSGCLDRQRRLLVKGRFACNNFEEILCRYVNEYVLCNSCTSPDTILTKENRIFVQRCEQCGSGRSVAPIRAARV